MSEELIERLEDVQISLLKSMGKEIPSDRLEKIIAIVERITRIKNKEQST